jgi:hypothetical protein
MTINYVFKLSKHLFCLSDKEQTFFTSATKQILGNYPITAFGVERRPFHFYRCYCFYVFRPQFFISKHTEVFSYSVKCTFFDQIISINVVYCPTGFPIYEN